MTEFYRMADVGGLEMDLAIERDDDCADCARWLRWRIVRVDRTMLKDGRVFTQRHVVHHAVTKVGAKWWLRRQYPHNAYS